MVHEEGVVSTDPAGGRGPRGRATSTDPDGLGVRFGQGSLSVAHPALPNLRLARVDGPSLGFAPPPAHNAQTNATRVRRVSTERTVCRGV